MEKTILGRTGLSVTIAGLGCGGYSRIGSRKYGIEHSVNLVRYAYDRGINFFDTAIQYETQPIVGRGLEGIPRDSYIISTKYQPFIDGKRNPDDLESALDRSLAELRTDYADIFHMHGISPEFYNIVRDEFYPKLLKLKDKGKIRFIGITESFFHDPMHSMLENALNDALFDVIMVGYNILNPSARRKVLPLALQKNIGVLCMYPIRRPFYHPETLQEMLADLRERGKIDESIHDLNFLLEEGYVKSLAEAGCRYSRHAEGIHVVLTGPGTREHLDENIASTLAPPLPPEVEAKLYEMFKDSDAVSVL